MGMVADALVYDETYQRKQKLMQQKQVETWTQGIKLGGDAVLSGLREGAQGLFYKPLQGAMDQGAWGAAKGMGHGLLGAVAKPLSGEAALSQEDDV